MVYRELKLIPFSVSVAIAIGIFSVYGPTTDAATSEEAEVFAKLYGAQMTAALKSPGNDDNLSLARQLLEGVDKLMENPGLKILMCEKAYALVSGIPSAFAEGESALSHIAEVDPTRLKEITQKRLALLEQAYQRSPSKVRKQITPLYLKAIMAMGELHISEEKISEALVVYRKAQSVARLAGAKNKKVLKDRIDEIVKLHAAQRRAKRFADRIAKNSEDIDAAKELVRIYLMEFTNPKEARHYAAMTRDPGLRRITMIGILNINDLNTLAALEMAEYYQRLASEARPGQKKWLLERADVAVKRALALEDEKGSLEATKAKLLGAQISRALASVNKELANAPSIITRPSVQSDTSVSWHTFNNGRSSNYRLGFIRNGKVLRGNKTVGRWSLKGRTFVLTVKLGDSVRSYQFDLYKGVYTSESQYVKLKREKASASK